MLIAVADLAAAAREMEERHGLASIEGGRHPGWGTANRIVPLGETYLELVAVVDEVEANQSVFGRWVASGSTIPSAPLGWAVRTPNVDDIARRLGLNVQAGSRVTASGTRLQWRSAGMEEAAADPSLPFFIDWAPGTELPGRALVKHPGGSATITRVLIRGDSDRLSDWLDGHKLPIIVTPGNPKLTGIVLSRTDGGIVLGMASP